MTKPLLSSQPSYSILLVFTNTVSLQMCRSLSFRPLHPDYISTRVTVLNGTVAKLSEELENSFTKGNDDYLYPDIISSLPTTSSILTSVFKQDLLYQTLLVSLLHRRVTKVKTTNPRTRTTCGGRRKSLAIIVAKLNIFIPLSRAQRLWREGHRRGQNWFH